MPFWAYRSVNSKAQFQTWPSSATSPSFAINENGTDCYFWEEKRQEKKKEKKTRNKKGTMSRRGNIKRRRKSARKPSSELCKQASGPRLSFPAPPPAPVPCKPYGFSGRKTSSNRKHTILLQKESKETRTAEHTQGQGRIVININRDYLCVPLG